MIKGVKKQITSLHPLLYDMYTSHTDIRENGLFTLPDKTFLVLKHTKQNPSEDKLLNFHKPKKVSEKALTRACWHDIIIKLSDESTKQKEINRYKKYLEN